MSGAKDGAVREYVIDGTTAVDDLLFAGLYAQMDSRVLEALSEVSLDAARMAPSVLSEALARANEMLEAASDEESGLDKDGLEALSSTSDSSGEEAAFESAAFAMDGLEEGEFAEESGMAEEMGAEKLLEMPEGLTPVALPQMVGEDDVLILMGTVLTTVEELVTVAVGGDSREEVGVWELGSLCCLADRKVIGYVIDTMGPTTRPLYVVKRTCGGDIQVEAGQNIYTTQASALAAVAPN